MNLNLNRYLQRLLLIWLMSFSLLGVQLIQQSPLHNHSQHVVDCGLCHFHFDDEALPLAENSLTFNKTGVVFTASIIPFYSSQTATPYQSRAPPTVFS